MMTSAAIAVLIVILDSFTFEARQHYVKSKNSLTYAVGALFFFIVSIAAYITKKIVMHI